MAKLVTGPSSELDTVVLNRPNETDFVTKLIDPQVRENNSAVITVKPAAVQDVDSFSQLLATLKDLPNSRPLVLDLSGLKAADTGKYADRLSNALVFLNKKQDGELVVLLPENHNLREYLKTAGLLKQDFLRVRVSLSEADKALGLTASPNSVEMRERLLSELLEKKENRVCSQDVLSHTNFKAKQEGTFSTSVEKEPKKVTLTPGDAHTSGGTHLSEENDGWKKFDTALQDAVNAAEPQQVTIDLQHCKSIGTYALSHIVTAGGKIQKKGGDLVLKNTPNDAKERLARLRVSGVVVTVE